MDDRRLNTRRESDHCPFQLEIQELNNQANKIEAFVKEAEPLLEYIRSEIKHKNRRSEFYQSLSERILGTAIFAIFAIIGSWVLEKLKIDFGRH